MTPVLNEKRRGNKLLLAFFILSGSLPAEPRNFFRGVWDCTKETCGAPARWKEAEWGAAAAAGLGLLAIAGSDPLLYRNIRARQPWLDAAMPVARDLGETYGILGTAGLWLGAELLHQEELASTASTALGAVAVAGILSSLLKPAFAANRPGTDSGNHAFFEYQGGRFNILNGSFPSGHTMVAFTLAETFGSSYGRWWTYPLAACTAYSRIYEGAHWPSDVLLGAALGMGIGRIAVKLKDEKGPAMRLWAVPAPGGGVHAGLSGEF